MGKRLKWSELKDLRDLVATQNVALLSAVLDTVKKNKQHFDTNTDDRNYVLGTLDTLNKNTADIGIASDKVNELTVGIIKDTKKDNVKTKDTVGYLSLLTELQKYGEVVALTGSDLIIELITRLKVDGNEVIEEVVKTTENYLGETEDGNK
jgi:hypothetical protein